MRIGMQEQAAATLSDLALHDATMQDAIIEEGGVQPLLNLVKVCNTSARHHARPTGITTIRWLSPRGSACHTTATPAF